MFNSSRNFLQTYSEMWNYICDTIFRLPEAVREVLLKCWENLRKLFWMKFILKLICIVFPYPSPPGKPLLSPGKSFAPSQADQIPKLSPPLDTSTIALVSTFSLILSHSYNHVQKFWDFLMSEQIFLSPQVKRSVIISNELVCTTCLTSCQTT